MSNEDIIKTLEENHNVCFNKGRDFAKAYDEAIQIIKQLTSLESELYAYNNCYAEFWSGADNYDKAIQVLKQLSSLESEYKAYHIDCDDYWRGVEHSLNVLNHKN